MRNKDKSDIDILRHMLRYCNNIEELIQRFGNDFSIFEKDIAFRDAVSMNILQIGELTGRLSEEYRSRTSSEIPWKAIKGMRNLFAHNYLQMDTEVIWSTAVESIPQLQEFCKIQIQNDEYLSDQSIEAEDDGLEI